MANSLQQKLFLKPGQSVLLNKVPSGEDPLIAILRETNAVSLDSASGGPFDLILAYFYLWTDVEAQFQDLVARLSPGGKLWIVFPKKTAKQKSDLSRDILHERMMTTFGWEFTTLISLDETWSAFRLSPPGK
jgi:DTW domain-containing protein YfiP